MERKCGNIYLPMPSLGSVRPMERFKRWPQFPVPVTHEMIHRWNALADAINRFNRDVDEVERLAHFYALLCEEYSNGRESRFAEFMEKLTEIPR